jgi:hypothetical protein
VAVRAGEEDELMTAVAGLFGGGEEGVSCYDEGRKVGGATALTGDTSGPWTCEAEQASEGAGCGLFYERKSWRYLVDMNLEYVSWLRGRTGLLVCISMTCIGVENREEHFRYHTDLRSLVPVTLPYRSAEIMRAYSIGA